MNDFMSSEESFCLCLSDTKKAPNIALGAMVNFTNQYSS